MNIDVLIQEIIDQICLNLGTTLNAPVHTERAAVSGEAWTLRIRSLDLPAVTMSFDQLGAGELVRIMTGQDEPTEEATQNSLRELCSHAINAAAATLTGANDGTIDIEGPDLGVWPNSATSVTTGFSSATLPVILVVSIEAEGQSARPMDSQSALDSPAPLINAADRIDVLLDIDLPLVVRFGCTQLPLKALSRLGPGSLIDLSRLPDDPVEMLVGDRVVARGEVVVVSGSYGVRITDVVSGRDGARGVEAS
jgi:flagellar motor switch protein FliN